MKVSLLKITVLRIHIYVNVHGDDGDPVYDSSSEISISIEDLAGHHFYISHILVLPLMMIVSTLSQFIYL